MKRKKNYFIAIARHIKTKPHYFSFSVLLVLILIIMGEVFIFVRTPAQRGNDAPLSLLADTVIQACSSSTYHPACYDKAIPKLMDTISLEQAFEVTRLIQKKDSAYWYCHVLGHNIAARETAKDPAKWKEVIPRCPSDMCSNGCIHGALQERFRKDTFSKDDIVRILPDLNDVCDEKPQWHPTGMERATCYHALGHLLMYLTDADTKKSSEMCKSIAVKPNGDDFLTVCYDGVFMQLFQPLEPEDFALVKGKVPKKEDLKTFCAPYPTQPRASCWSEGWPLFWSEVKTPKGLVKFCSVLPEGSMRERCYNGMFFIMASQVQLDEGKIINFCKDIPLPARERCFANAAGRMVETDAKLIDRSLSVCAAANKWHAGDACYRELLMYSQFNFHYGSPDFFNLCNGLPDQWKKQCLSDAQPQ